MLFVFDSFDGEAPDSSLHWFNPPARWRLNASRLIVEPDEGTDYWQKTHYGFRADNGPFLYAEIEGDFELSATVHPFPVHQYDQAGLMVRISPYCWLKTSIEYEPEGPSRLGSVVTNRGFSDWATQDIAPGGGAHAFRIRRAGGDYTVEFRRTPDAAWMQIRLARLHDDLGGAPVQCGLYACSPRGAGFRAEFDELRIETPEADSKPEAGGAC